jgi:hypothetical protein
MENTEVRVDIPEDVSEKIEILFGRYNGYMSILEYLARVGSLDETNKFFDKKWDETVQIYIELEAAKTAADKEFHPNGEYSSYRFDFINQQMVYTK